MPIVWLCSLSVDRYAALGREVDAPRPACPLCAGPTQRWSGYRRHVRDEVDRLIWVPRVRCTVCGVTAVHALAGRWPGERSAEPWSIAVLVTGGRRPC